MIAFACGFIAGSLVALLYVAVFLVPIADDLREEIARLKIDQRHK